MRVLLPGLLAALLLAAPASAAAPPCYAKKRGVVRETVVRNEAVRVYRRTPRGFEDWVYYACDRRGGGVVKLGYDDGPGDIRIAGRYLAYRDTHFRSPGDVHSEVRLIDVRAGRTLHRWRYSDYHFEPHAELEHFRHALTAGGAYAFLVGTFNAKSGGPIFDPPPYEVVAATPREARILETAPDIDPASFSVDGGVVRWRRAGEERAVEIEPG